MLCALHSCILYFMQRRDNISITVASHPSSNSIIRGSAFKPRATEENRPLAVWRLVAHTSFFCLIIMEKIRVVRCLAAFLHRSSYDRSPRSIFKPVLANHNYFTELGEVNWTKFFLIFSGHPPLTALFPHETLQNEQLQTPCS
jgi:hypothetical protein